MMTATNTQDTKLLPIPGRLLPDCKLSSSHDTGLDRLGMRQQATKGTPQSSQQQNQDASQSPQSLDPHIKGLAVNTAIRRVATPSESDEEEYDDATSFHQSANQRQSLQSEGYHAKTPRQPSCGDNPHTLTVSFSRFVLLCLCIYYLWFQRGFQLSVRSLQPHLPSIEYPHLLTRTLKSTLIPLPFNKT